MAKPKFPATSIATDHPDFSTLSKVRDAIYEKVGGAEKLIDDLPSIIKDAVDFVLDPETTLRTQICELDKVEKTFIGLKIEHFLRDLIGCPKGLKRDAKIADIEIDIKNTIGSTWMIPRETYRDEEPCILIATAKFDGRCWLGLVVARDRYLNAPNQDKKRSVSEEGKKNILWLVRDAPYPQSRWHGIDMQRFKELRDTEKTGNKRAAQFFRENLQRVVHRSVVKALLFDQDDYMRRLRKDAGRGTKEVLSNEGIVLACGAWEETCLDAARNGFPTLSKDEWVAYKPSR